MKHCSSCRHVFALGTPADTELFCMNGELRQVLNPHTGRINFSCGTVRSDAGECGPEALLFAARAVVKSCRQDEM